MKYAYITDVNARNRRIAWKTWYHMKHRCANHPAYKHISVDPLWMDFEVFYTDMGPRPSDTHSLDRVGNASIYSKATCKWSTLEEQAGNRPGFIIDIEYLGVRTNLKALCRQLNVPYLPVYHKYRRGIPIHQLLRIHSDSLIMV